MRDLNEIVRIDLANGTAQRVAGTSCGTGTPVQDGVGLDATNVAFNWDLDLAVAPNGDVYFTDASNDPSLIYRVDAATRTLEVAAGNGTQGDTGDGGPAQDASISVNGGSIWVDDGGPVVSPGRARVSSRGHVGRDNRDRGR